MNLQCQAQYALAADVTSLASMAMDENLPAGFEPGSGGLTTATSGSPVTDADGITYWKILAQRLLRARIDPVETMKLIQGHSLAFAVRQLPTSFRLATKPIIKVTPAWWPWLPVFPFRIAVSTGG
jgi:hypothetical protein